MAGTWYDINSDESLNVSQLMTVGVAAEGSGPTYKVVVRPNTGLSLVVATGLTQSAARVLATKIKRSAGPDQTGDPFYFTEADGLTITVPTGGKILGIAAWHTTAGVTRTFSVNGGSPISVYPNVPVFWNPLGNYGEGTQVVFGSGLSFIVEGATE